MFSEQGSTRYAELQLVTEHVSQRSLTVGMTRHTDDYEMFFSREAVGSFDDLVALGERTRSKQLASDFAVIERKLYKVEELTIGTLYDRVSDIAMGLSLGTYSAEERQAALAVRSVAGPLDRDNSVWWKNALGTSTRYRRGSSDSSSRRLRKLQRCDANGISKHRCST